MTRQATAHIALDRLTHNAAVLRHAAPDSKLLAVIKADAYGHGAVACAQALAGSADALAVATLDEALTLRGHGVGTRIVVLHDITDAGQLQRACDADCEWTIYDAAQVALIESRGESCAGRTVWLKINTGMNRLGIAPEHAADLHARLTACGVTIVLMTHLSSAGEPDDTASSEQLARFAALDLPGERTAANSAATLRYPASHLDWIRPGLALYGIAPGPDACADLQPVMRLEAPLLCIQQLAAGERIGYGGTYVCPEAMPVGIVGAGYADGVPYAAPGNAQVAIGDATADVLGRVSMDLTAIDLRGIDAAPGMPVELWGDTIGVDTLAGASGTIAYELLCRAAPLRHRYTPA